MKSIAHTTSLYLRRLLVIIRLYSVYRLFDTRIWFTKKWSIIHCIPTLVSCVTVGFILNFTYAKVLIRPHFDDLWGALQNYNACSLNPSVVLDKGICIQAVVTHVVLLILNILGLVGTSVCFIFFIVKLRRLNFRRKDLT